MKSIIVLSFFLIFNNLFNAQYIAVKGKNGEILNRVDSLSFERSNLFSEFYVDSLTGSPYSGIAEQKLQLYKYVFQLKNGINDGFSYEIMRNNENDTIITSEVIKYYNQKLRIMVTKLNFYNLKKEKATINTETNLMNTICELNYKKEKIILKKTITYRDGKKEKSKVKFYSIEELKNYFKEDNYKKIYKDSGIFEWWKQKTNI